MGLTFFIVDDDPGSRRMLQLIIEESDLGEVIGTAQGGLAAESAVLTKQPDVVLIDLLMPDQDGIETMDQLIQKGYRGVFIMISQVVNKEMVGEAYQKGVEFFIHKPINRIEVESLLHRIKEHLQMKRSLQAIRQSLAGFTPEPQNQPAMNASVRDIVLTIINDMGITGESGSADLVRMMEVMVEKYRNQDFPSLKELYEGVARKTKETSANISKESKAIEQRIRRTIAAALTNLASLGLTDYANPKFEHYAPRFFDFPDVRARMRELDGEEEDSKTKINTKKFIQVLYFETIDKMKP